MTLTLGDHISCGSIFPSAVGSGDERTQEVYADVVNAMSVTSATLSAASIVVNGAPLSTVCVTNNFSDLDGLPTIDAEVTHGSANAVSGNGVHVMRTQMEGSNAITYAEKASPTFSGTVTAPVIQATVTIGRPKRIGTNRLWCHQGEHDGPDKIISRQRK